MKILKKDLEHKIDLKYCVIYRNISLTTQERRNKIVLV